MPKAWSHDLSSPSSIRSSLSPWTQVCSRRPSLCSSSWTFLLWRKPGFVDSALLFCCWRRSTSNWHRRCLTSSWRTGMFVSFALGVWSYQMRRQPWEEAYRPLVPAKTIRWSCSQRTEQRTTIYGKERESVSSLSFFFVWLVRIAAVWTNQICVNSIVWRLSGGFCKCTRNGPRPCWRHSRLWSLVRCWSWILMRSSSFQF